MSRVRSPVSRCQDLAVNESRTRNTSNYAASVIEVAIHARGRWVRPSGTDGARLTGGGGRHGHVGRNSKSAWLTAAGLSCWTRWPAPSTTTVRTPGMAASMAATAGPWAPSCGHIHAGRSPPSGVRRRQAQVSDGARSTRAQGSHGKERPAGHPPRSRGEARCRRRSRGSGGEGRGRDATLGSTNAEPAIPSCVRQALLTVPIRQPSAKKVSPRASGSSRR